MKRQKQTHTQAAHIPFSPASALMISPARTQRCSWARHGTSWCLPSYLGAPTHSCGDAGGREGRGERWERTNPHQVVSIATNGVFFTLT